jgi:hypothetical protein
MKSRESRNFTSACACANFFEVSDFLAQLPGENLARKLLKRQDNTVPRKEANKNAAQSFIPISRSVAKGL